jgi:hypothetical protein
VFVRTEPRSVYPACPEGRRELRGTVAPFRSVGSSPCLRATPGQPALSLEGSLSCPAQLVCTHSQKRRFLSPLFATLTYSAGCKSFPCLYENIPGDSQSLHLYFATSLLRSLPTLTPATSCGINRLLHDSLYTPGVGGAKPKMRLQGALLTTHYSLPTCLSFPPQPACIFNIQLILVRKPDVYSLYG